MLSNKPPIFPVQEPHFTDYGFEPQFHYFQVLEEARNHRRERTAIARSSVDDDMMNFKLQKPISRDDSSSLSKKIKKTKNTRRWWRNALLFFRFPRSPPPDNRINYNIGSSISGPLYITDSIAGGSPAPYRTASRPSSGPLVKGEVVDIPYVSLADGNCRTSSAAATPIYLVT
ncbi:uncharacterized protein LOC127250148 [Andrographis paniculata]|uniref:uncharacterized protein LOC127250148 n=1 Tax=Andrographis paniculata TaxID=175694 RepID=UPI0021E78D5F|nr:uncharacterized protein LOC127250148 [Andrographis paniculata]